MTLEEILAAMNSNPEIMTGVIQAIPTLDAGKELLNNHAKQHFDQNIGPKVAEIYSNIDQDIFDILGIRKDKDTKTYDFLKNEVLSKFKELKEKGNVTDDEKQQKIDSLEQKVQELTQAGADGQFWKNSLEEAQKKWDKEKTELQGTIDNHVKENRTFVVSNDLATGLSGLKFNPNIPESAINALTDSIKNSAIANSKIVEGKVVYLKEDGTPWLNNEFKPITAKDIFAEKMGDVLETSSGGGGAAPKKTGKIITVGEGDSATKKVTLDPSTFNTKLQFHNEIEKVLTKEGVEKNSKQWNDLTTEAYKEYGVADMERQ